MGCRVFTERSFLFCGFFLADYEVAGVSRGATRAVAGSKKLMTLRVPSDGDNLEMAFDIEKLFQRGHKIIVSVGEVVNVVSARDDAQVFFGALSFRAHHDVGLKFLAIREAFEEIGASILSWSLRGSIVVSTTTADYYEKDWNKPE